MLISRVLDSCDPGIQIETPKSRQDLGDGVARAMK
jgi:hypothetical protein